MHESVETVVDYLMARVLALKAEGEALREENAALRGKVDELERLANSAQRAGDGLAGDGGPPREAQQGPDVSESVLDAARFMSMALLEPLSSRPDLDIKGMRFLQAIRAGNLAKVTEMIQGNNALMEMRSLTSSFTFGFTPLHIAADVGKKEVCKVLLANGADPFATDLVGRTPLHVAASKLHNVVVELLMEVMGNVRGERAPPDASGITPAGYSALSKASREQRNDSLRILHREGDACISPLVRRSSARRAERGGPNTRNRKSNLYSEMIVERLAKASPSRPGAEVQPALRYGSASLPGYRVAMEDALCLASAVGPRGELAVFAVFDGHGGRTAAKFASEEICGVLEAQPEVVSGEAARDNEALRAALHNACIELDQRMSQLDCFRPQEIIEQAFGDEPSAVRVEVEDGSGSTAAIVVVSPVALAVANIGDSRTLVLENGELKLATRDQQPSTDETDAWWAGELERIRRAGGDVDENRRVLRVRGDTRSHLAMSRALGDFEYKLEGRAVVVAEPEIYMRERGSSEQVCIIACDGIWDVLSSEACMDLVLSEPAVASQLSGAQDPHDPELDGVCNKVALACLESFDNLSMIVVRVPGRAGPGAASGQPVRSSLGVQRNLLGVFDQAGSGEDSEFAPPLAQGPVSPLAPQSAGQPGGGEAPADRVAELLEAVSLV